MSCHFSLSKISLNKTVSLSKFGNSTPIAFCPGTTATLTETALIDLAISSAKLTTLEVLVPGDGFRSYLVTTGPVNAVAISPLIPKSSNTLSSILELAFRTSSDGPANPSIEGFNNSTDGRL